METIDIRGITLRLDEAREADIIDSINDMKEKHQLSDFMSNMIRIVFNNKELLNAVVSASNIGITHQREDFFKELEHRVRGMEDKINEIYDIGLHIYTLALMNKYLKLEERSDNLLCGEFVVEQELRKLSDAIGVTLEGTRLNSHQLDEAHIRAKDSLEFIIENYNGIVSELQHITEPRRVVSTVQQTQAPVVQNTIKAESPKVVGKAETKKVEITKEDEEEYVDFGDADIGALAAFLSGAK